MKFYEYKLGSFEKVIHFIAANGYPPNSYKSFFNSIENVHIYSFLLRPLTGNYEEVELESWFDFVDDMHDYVEKFQPKVVMGHSIGAVLWLLYSIKYNYEFEKIILIDPAIFSPKIVLLFNILRMLRIHEKMHPHILPTLRRQQVFNSKEDIFTKYRSKKIFKFVSDDVLDDYIDALFEKQGKEYKITFSPQWEAKIYERGIIEDALIWKYLNRTSAKIYLVWGEFSNICSDKIELMFKNRCKLFKSYKINDTSHLLPLENPRRVGSIVNQIIDY